MLKYSFVYVIVYIYRSFIMILMRTKFRHMLILFIFIFITIMLTLHMSSFNQSKNNSLPASIPILYENNHRSFDLPMQNPQNLSLKEWELRGLSVKGNHKDKNDNVIRALPLPWKVNPRHIEFDYVYESDRDVANTVSCEDTVCLDFLTEDEKNSFNNCLSTATKRLKFLSSKTSKTNSLGVSPGNTKSASGSCHFRDGRGTKLINK